MRVDALQEAIIHIGTEWQASKVKLALSCHANYRWICARPLKVNKNDYDLEKIKNLISGVWNSSDISLDLGKLHNQIQTMEHSRLNFTAAGVGSDFFHSFSNFISGKNILSTIFSYAAVATLILLLIIILPCIVRILWHSIQKLATELHLVVLRNKKGEMPWASTGDPTHEKVMRRDLMGQGESGLKWFSAWAFTPPKKNLSVYCLIYYTLLTLQGAIPNHLSLEKVNLELKLFSCIWKECLSSNPSDGSLMCLTGSPGLLQLVNCVHPTNPARGMQLKAS